MRAKYIVIIFLTLFTLGFSACAGPLPTSPFSSPISPIPTPEEESTTSIYQITGPNFEIDKPVLPEATKITGQGPIGIPIIIVDMTMMGAPLGNGTIGPDGKFVVQLNKPAIENHLLGIQIGPDFQFTTPEIAEQLLAKKGPGFRNYPQVGLAYDTAIVRQP